MENTLQIQDRVAVNKISIYLQIQLIVVMSLYSAILPIGYLSHMQALKTQ
jgi:signal peptidase I